ncbi:hypothetical protein [Streptomyces sp. ST2-7A]|uniref:hypothetical protein n=1 Tax=Streptomyces sp. ST2-7A TaxID=2907214 RepID=UPI001F27679A|nr:hypothetical protein [Streptomyces sp. ST2-7A]MCE7079243.1 hypothetical protein [Streptomyces sp. ST2-7A]
MTESPAGPSGPGVGGRIRSAGPLTVADLRARGIGRAEAARRCRPDGPWQMPFPGVHLSHPGPISRSERLRAALVWAGGRPGEVLFGGITALELHDPEPAGCHDPGSAPPPPITLMVPHTRRLRPPAGIRLLRTRELPRPVWIDGLPVVPVARAVADAVVPEPGPVEGDPSAGRALMAAALIGGHCTARELAREVGRLRPNRRRGPARALEEACAEARAVAQDSLREVVRVVVGPAGRGDARGDATGGATAGAMDRPGTDPAEAGPAEPFWNVELRPSGEAPGGADAYWPGEGVALVLDTRRYSPGTAHLPGAFRDPGHARRGEAEETAGYVRWRETLERSGVTVVHLTPRGLRETPDLQAVVIRTALTGASARPSGRCVGVLPR